MQTIIIQTDTLANAHLLSSFLKNVRIVKSVSVKPDVKKANLVKESESEYNWTNPSRPATDEEIEQMLDECEKGPFLSSGEARKLTRKELSEWRKKK